MDTEPAGEYIALVVRVQPNVDGTWYVYADGVNTAEAFPLVPITLVLRLWRSRATGVLRGGIQLHGSDSWVPIQSNTQIEELVRTWLSSGGPAPRVE